MSGYKRLTIKDEEYGNYVDNKGSKLNKPKVAVSFNGKIHGAVIDRLAELEDKIENGTLVELPCKVGDKVYHLSDKKICEEVVKQIKYSIYNGEIDLLNSHIMTDDLYSKDYNFYRVSKLGKSLFLTKAEAEKKLLELQGDK